MEFIRKLLGKSDKKEEPVRGMAPSQSQAEQDHTRTQMEAEMAEQKERRDAAKPTE